MSNLATLTRLSSAICTLSDGAGRVQVEDLRNVGFDDETIRTLGPDAIRLTMVREVTTLRLELVAGRK